MAKTQEKSGIGKKIGVKLRPNEINIDYMITVQELVKPIDDMDYDINVSNLNLTPLKFLKSKKELYGLIEETRTYTISNLRYLDLIGLSNAGLGMYSQSDGSTLNLLDPFVDCINKAIRKEKENEEKYRKTWASQYDVLMNKYQEAQCKNKVSLKVLKTLSKKIEKYLIKINKTFESNKARVLKKLVQELYSFICEEICSSKYAYLFENQFGNDLFKKLGCKHYEKLDYSQVRDIYYLKELIEEYNYFLMHYRNFLVSALQQFSERKIKKATDIFKVDSKELKIKTFKQFNPIFEVKFESDFKPAEGKEDDEEELRRGEEAFAKYEEEFHRYNECNVYNYESLYDFFRDSVISIVTEAVTLDIYRRKVIDDIIQYTPTASSFIAFVFGVGLSLVFNYTLLKETWERHIIMNIFVVMSVGILFALINLLRNSVQFKRPKKTKFSVTSIILIFIMSCGFNVLNNYFITRYDGYNDKYYYIYDDNGGIIIDGLVDKDNGYHTIPEKIDELEVSLVSNKTFQKNYYLNFLDMKYTNAQIEEGAFKNCFKLEYVELSQNITVIPDEAFLNCGSLKTITSEYVEVIGKSAFENCVELYQLDISNVQELGSKAFLNCEEISQVVFCDDLEVIPEATFENCIKLTFDSLPNNIKEIKQYAFGDCKQIKKVMLGENIQLVEPNAFRNCSNIIEIEILNFNAIKDHSLETIFDGDAKEKIRNIKIGNITEIPAGYFENLEETKYITLEGQISKIGDRAFKNCANLLEINISGVITELGKESFFGCHSLKSFDFASLEVTEIPEKTFFDCNDLENIEIPNKVKTIGDKAFSGCDKIDVLLLPNTVTSIGKEAFYYCGYISELSLKAYNNTIKLSDFLSTDAIEEIRKITLLDTTEIPNNFFNQCLKLEDVLFDKSPTIIGEYAFANCDLLTDEDYEFLQDVVEIKEGAFYNCNFLTNVKLTDTLKTIGNYAFGKCNSIIEITIPNSVTTIGTDIFEYCANLTKITMPLYNKTVTEVISQYSFERLQTLEVNVNDTTSLVDRYLANAPSLKSLSFNGTVTSIGVSALQNCSKLTNENFEFIKGATEIKERAFYGCLGLNTIELNSNLEVISDYTFSDCINLSSINIPDSVKIIGKEVFYRCDLVTSLTLGKNIESIGEDAFGRCSSLTDLNVYIINNTLSEFLSVEVAQNISKLTVNVNKLNYIPDNYFKNLQKINYVTINGEIVSIGKFAFSGCTNLNNFAIPETVTSIGNCAFRNCDTLTEMTIPNSVTSIGENIFEGCSQLQMLTMPLYDKTVANVISHYSKNILKNLTVNVVNTTALIDNYLSGASKLMNFSINGELTSIGKRAFENCTLLNEFQIPATVTEIGSYAFNNCKNFVNVEIPQGIIALGDNIFNGISGLTSLKTPIIDKPLYQVLGEEQISNITSLNVYTTTLNKIPSMYFAGAENLVSLTVTGDITTIEEFAFAECRSLSGYLVPETVTDIKSYAFANCESFTDFRFGKNDINLGKDLFLGCVNLHSVSIPLIDQPLEITIGKDIIGNITHVSTYSETIDYIPDGYFRNLRRLNSFEITSEINTIGIEAFKNCENLSDFIIPDTVVEIKDRAFEGCTNFFNVQIPTTVQTVGRGLFDKCFRIKLLEIPLINTTSIFNYIDDCMQPDSQIVIIDGIIPESYFKGFVSLKSYDFSNVESIGNYAFEESGIQHIDINANVTSLGEGVFKKAAVITANITGLTEIPNHMFDNCNSLKTFDLSGVKKIGYYAFDNCYSLVSLTNIETLEEIKEGAFRNCERLEIGDVFDQFTLIESYAFEGNYALSEVSITSYKTIYQQDVFINCNNIKKINISQSLKEIHPISYYFGKNGLKKLNHVCVTDVVRIDSEYFEGCENATTIELYGPASKVETETFKGFHKLLEIILPTQIEVIEENAFKECYYLNVMVLPDTVKRIEDGAFRSCGNLKNLYIPSNIEYIGKKAFHIASTYTNIEETSQSNMALWHNNWNSQREVTFTNVLEDILIFVMANLTLCISVGSGLLLLIIILIIVKVKKSRKTYKSKKYRKKRY